MRKTIGQLAAVFALLVSGVLMAQPAPPTTTTPGAPATTSAGPDLPAREDWEFRGVKGETLRTTHYRVYTTERDSILKSRLAESLELALAQYRSAITDLPAPTTRLDVYLMDDRAQWETVTKLLMGEHADKLLRIPSGGYASRSIGVYYDIGLYGTIAIAAHEGWHQYTQQVFKDHLPIWLEEGIASFMEGHRWNGRTPEFRPWANLERFDQLRKAHAGGRLLSLEDLLKTDPKGLFAGQSTGALDYYAQVWALAHFLREGEDAKHREKFAELLTDAAAGRLNKRLLETQPRADAVESMTRRTGPAVLRAYFADDLGAMGEAYGAFVDKIVSVGGREAIVEGRSPIPAAGP